LPSASATPGDLPAFISRVSLAAAATHPQRSAEVRKGCVFVYVELYKVPTAFLQPLSFLLMCCQVLGDGLQPHLKGLSASQVIMLPLYLQCWGASGDSCAGQARERLHFKGSA
jgi:hypothetical protein